MNSLHRTPSVLLPLLPIVCLLSVSARAQGTAVVSYTEPDNSGTATVSVDMTAVTGGTVTVTKSDGTTVVLSPGGGTATFTLSGAHVVKVKSSSGPDTWYEFYISGGKTRFRKGAGVGGAAGSGPDLALSEPPAPAEE